MAGNVQSSFALGTSSVAFEFDATAPGIGFTNPDAPRENNLTSLSGTASDEDGGPALAVVQVRVQRLTGIEYYLTPGTLQFDGNTPNPDNAWINASYTLNWTSWYLSSGIPWVSGEQDVPGDGPLDRPGGELLGALRQLHGGLRQHPAADPGRFPRQRLGDRRPADDLGHDVGRAGRRPEPGAGDERGLAGERGLSDGECWDGASWRNSGCPQTMGTAAGVQVWTTSWTVASGNLPTLTTGTSYWISSSGTDNTSPSGNVEGFGSVRGSTFTFDSTPPLSRIQAPVSGAYYSSLNTMSGTMTDLPSPPLVNAGINQVQVLIQRLTSDATTYWNGGVWQAGPFWNQASTPTAGTWVYNSSGLPWAHGTSYLVVSQSSDNAGNVENSFSVSANSNTFTFDVQAPTAALTTPAYIDAAVTSLSGTALDAPAGVASLSVALSSAGGAGGWWNGSSFNGAAPVYFATSSYVYGPPDHWTVPLATSSLVNDVSYLAQSQASDRAGNSRVQVLGSFTFNNQAPTAVIQAPANNDYYNSLPTISGASTGNVGISTIALSVQDADTGQCYAPGSGFSAGCPNYFAAGGTPGAWSYGGIAWSDGNDYVVTARATDVAGNVQSSFALGTSSVAFEFDATAPGDRVHEPGRGAGEQPDDLVGHGLRRGRRAGLGGGAGPGAAAHGHRVLPDARDPAVRRQHAQSRQRVDQRVLHAQLDELVPLQRDPLGLRGAVPGDGPLDRPGGELLGALRQLHGGLRQHAAADPGRFPRQRLGDRRPADDLGHDVGRAGRRPEPGAGDERGLAGDAALGRRVLGRGELAQQRLPADDGSGGGGAGLDDVVDGGEREPADADDRDVLLHQLLGHRQHLAERQRGGLRQREGLDLHLRLDAAAEPHPGAGERGLL